MVILQRKLYFSKDPEGSNIYQGGGGGGGGVVAVIMLPALSASFAHNFVSGMQSFYLSESRDAIVLQTCH